MQSFDLYLTRTETAVRKLFEGIAYYTDMLKAIRGTTFVSGELDREKFMVQYERWAEKNAKTLVRSVAAQQKFAEQSFAMATLCGAVLQVAAKAIECYSPVKRVPSELVAVVGNSKPATPFCVGRELRGLPIGLIVYAGRNQHTHFNEKRYNKVNEAVFNQLAVFNHLRDPGLDLANPLLESFASNITFILGWRSYEAYDEDMKGMLREKTYPSIEGASSRPFTNP